METSGHEKVLAIQFAKFIKANYQIEKGGKYRHRGDFYKNTHPIDEIQLFDIFMDNKKQK